MSIKTIILILLTGLLMVSCYKPYIADIDNNEEVLVVDGLITNEVTGHHIKLYHASQFYSSENNSPVRNAKVSVTDNDGKSIDFREMNDGDYVSDPTTFLAAPGNSYILRIETQEGEIYESSAQVMMPEFHPDTVYSVVDYKTYISRFNQVLKTITGAAILLDVDGESEPLPGFRFDITMIELYMYAINIPPPYIYPPLYLFYCWQTDNSLKDLVISNPKSIYSNSIQKQYIDFVSNQTYLEGRVYELGSLLPDQSYTGIPSSERKTYSLSGRVMYVDQYSLNEDAFRYYQRINDLLTSEGKLFDPISVQLEGNVKCISEQGRLAVGFFEVSAFNKSAYRVGNRNPVTDQFPVTEITCILPPALNGCVINKVPVFWSNSIQK